MARRVLAVRSEGARRSGHCRPESNAWSIEKSRAPGGMPSTLCALGLVLRSRVVGLQAVAPRLLGGTQLAIQALWLAASSEKDWGHPDDHARYRLGTGERSARPYPFGSSQLGRVGLIRPS